MEVYVSLEISEQWEQIMLHLFVCVRKYQMIVTSAHKWGSKL